MLEERSLLDIQNLFIHIRFIAREKNNSALQSCAMKIEEKRALVVYFSEGFQRDIFVYCFDILKELIESKQYDFIADFADAIHNLPEIFLYEYKDFCKIYIEPLREKYGGHLFLEFIDCFNGMNTNLGLKSRYANVPLREVTKDECTLLGLTAGSSLTVEKFLDMTREDKW